jgi:hypothetical protein
MNYNKIMFACIIFIIFIFKIVSTLYPISSAGMWDGIAWGLILIYACKYLAEGISDKD